MSKTIVELGRMVGEQLERQVLGEVFGPIVVTAGPEDNPADEVEPYPVSEDDVEPEDDDDDWEEDEDDGYDDEEWDDECDE